jgi:hypothetical protein
MHADVESTSVREHGEQRERERRLGLARLSDQAGVLPRQQADEQASDRVCASTESGAQVGLCRLHFAL